MSKSCSSQYLSTRGQWMLVLTKPWHFIVCVGAEKLGLDALIVITFCNISCRVENVAESQLTVKVNYICTL